MGGKIHDAIESTIKGENDITAIAEAIKNELADLEMLDLTFPKDRNGGDSIRDNWIANMINMKYELIQKYLQYQKANSKQSNWYYFNPMANIGCKDI